MMDWRRLINPIYWIQNYKTDLSWDKTLNEAMDKYQIKRGYLTVNIGPLTVWVSNWPYAYGHPYQMYVPDALPTVKTRKRLREACKVDYTQLLKEPTK